MAKEIEYSEEVQRNLKTIIDHFDQSDRATRERQIRLWKKLEFYWSGMQRIWWDEVAHDWRVYDVESEADDNQAGYYDKPINVFRAYLESIIAALSATVPKIKCFPDDADNPSDLLTAKGGTKIASLVYDHIDADLLWIKALFVFCLQGMVAAYNYTAEDESYGTVEQDEYKDFEENESVSICPSCGKVFEGDELAVAKSIRSAEGDQFRPDQDTLIPELENEGIICPQCQMMINPDVQDRTITVRRIVGKINVPKARQCIDINGGLFVNVPNWARYQSDCLYLEYAYETHYANVLFKYPGLREKLGINNSNLSSSNAGSEWYGRWGRLSPQYLGETPENTPTVRNWWLRPAAFEVISDEAQRDELKKLFPNGAKCVFVNDQYAEAKQEKLDDYWTLTFNPLSEYIHFDPLGLLLVSVQDITNDLLSLTLQTIEHGIPQTFADPSVLNFEQYRNAEVAPGAVFPAKAKGGKNLGEGFYTVATATLSKEVDPFAERVNRLGQLASGAQPQLWGGSGPSNQRTATQDQMSLNQSIGRLQTTYKIFNSWWKNIFGKVIPAYIENMIDDERIVQEKGDSFVNLVIKKAEMDGKIGSIHLESSEELPKTWSQIRAMVMELINLNNPEIMTLLGAPENLEVLQKVFGATGLQVPNEKDRTKQYDEIGLLIKSEPFIAGNEVMPSIMPEELVDNHVVEAEICRSWLVGEAGRQAKMDNKAGYENVLAHFKAHVMFIQMKASQMQPVQETNNGV